MSTTLESTTLAAPKPREMMHLGTRSNARGAARAAIHLALLLGSAALIAGASGIWLLPAMLAMGIVQAALFAPFHETAHYTAFRARRANAVIGWIAGLPGLHNWHFYQQFHLAHHKHTGDPQRDPEYTPGPPRSLAGYPARVAGLFYWRARLQTWVAAWRGDMSAYPFLHPATAPRVIRSVRASSALTVALAVAAGLAFGWQAVVLYWIGPQLLGQPVLRLYLMAEHTGCTEDANGLTNTRTMITTPLVRLLMWNMPFHAEHHLYPFIPFHRLAEAHALLRDRLADVGTGYAAFHRDQIRRLLRGGAA